MATERLKHILVWLLIASAIIFLLERMLMVVTALASPLLLFSIAWLFVLALKPLVEGLMRVEVPIPVALVNRNNRIHIAVPIVRLPRVAATLLVYLGLFAVIAGAFVLLVPIILPQITGLQTNLPNAANEIQRFVESLQTSINRLGLRIDLSRVSQPEAISAQLGALGSELVRQSITIAGSIATLIFNLVFVLIVSFYMMLDGDRLVNRLISMLPNNWREEVSTFVSIVDRTFGGFLRAQLLQSFLYGLATAALMLALGLPDIALASVIAGLCVLIPIIGGFLAMVPPLVIALLNAPERVVWLIVGLFIIQQIIFNVIMPRLLGQIVGLPPLLVFAALLIGGTVAGWWGILFGIPIAGVLASVLQFMYDRSHTQLQQAPPSVAPVVDVVPSAAPPASPNPSK